MRSVYTNVITFLNKITTFVSMIMISSIASIMFLQVIFRYVLNNSLSWADEISRFLLIWISFLGISIAVWHNAHLKIDFFAKKLPPGLRRSVTLFVHIANFSFLLITFVSSFYVISISSSFSLVSVPLNWGQALISFPIGIGLSLLYYVNFIIRKKVE